MEKLELVKYGSPILRKRSSPVSEVTEEIKDFAERMFEVMYQAQGIGLAAPQIGKSTRLFVVDATKYIGDGHKPFIMVNPVILKKYGGWLMQKEGCLSIPGIEGDVRRTKRIRIKGIMLDKGEGLSSAKEVELDVADLLARIIQHEVDHLDGILFIDRLKLMDRCRLRRIIGREIR